MEDAMEAESKSVFAPKHILVATDFEAASARAEDLAIEIAGKFGAKITLVHVWSVPMPIYAGALSWPADGLERAARAALEDAATKLKARYPKCGAMLAAGFPSDAILATAAEEGVDMIVLGTHGRRGVQRVFLGSVAERVLRRSPVPVLTVSAA